jgi:hypothetical protein
MPKRWRIVSGSSFGYELLDEKGISVYTSPANWGSEQAVDDELGRIEDGDIEFPDKMVKGPKHRKGRKPRP